MKGMVPSLAVPQTAGKGARNAKASKAARPQAAGKQGAHAAVAGRTRFEAAVREKLAGKSPETAARFVKSADTKGMAPATRKVPTGQPMAKPENPAVDALSREKKREKEKSGVLLHEAPAALALPSAALPSAALPSAALPSVTLPSAALPSAARIRSAPKPVPTTEPSQAERRIEAAPATLRQVPAREPPSEIPRIVVTDLRRKSASDTRNQGAAENGDGRQAAVAAGKREIRTETKTAEGEGASKTTGRSSAVRESGATGPETAARETPAAAPQVPVESLRDILPPQLVKTAGIVVRDGDAGEIRLVLKPESLGSVRIRMSLGEDGIEGRIFVDTQAVKEIFEARLNDLEKALRQEGFQNANLSVSVSGGNPDGRRREEAASGPSPRQAGNEFERAIPTVESVSLGDYRVNLMV